MSLSATELASRMNRLSGTLQDLKGRVREAVAGETGKAVGDAIRDLLASALSERDSRSGYRSQDRVWEDEDDTPFYATATGAWKDEVNPRSSQVSPRWAAAVASSTAAVRCWASRQVPGWLSLIVGVVIGLTTLAGGVVAKATVALLTATVDLLPISDSHSRRILNLF